MHNEKFSGDPGGVLAELEFIINIKHVIPEPRTIGVQDDYVYFSLYVKTVFSERKLVFFCELLFLTKFFNCEFCLLCGFNMFLEAFLLRSMSYEGQVWYLVSLCEIFRGL